MKISELNTGQGSVNVEVVVKSKAPVRTFNKYGKDLRVANAVVSDESGEINMSLWNNDIELVNVNDTIKIVNGYVSEFNGIKQLSCGKYGKIEVVGSGGSDNSGSSGGSDDKKKHVSKEESVVKKKHVSEDVPEEEF